MTYRRNERYRNPWWVTPTEDPDTEQACEERRRAMDDDFRGRED